MKITSYLIVGTLGLLFTGSEAFAQRLEWRPYDHDFNKFWGSSYSDRETCERMKFSNQECIAVPASPKNKKTKRKVRKTHHSNRR